MFIKTIKTITLCCIFLFFISANCWAEGISTEKIVVYSDKSTNYINIAVEFKNNYDQAISGFSVKCIFTNELAPSDKKKLGSSTRFVSDTIGKGQAFSLVFSTELKAAENFVTNGNNQYIRIDEYWSRNTDTGKRLSESPRILNFPLHLEFKFY